MPQNIRTCKVWENSRLFSFKADRSATHLRLLIVCFLQMGSLLIVNIIWIHLCFLKITQRENYGLVVIHKSICNSFTTVAHLRWDWAVFGRKDCQEVKQQCVFLMNKSYLANTRNLSWKKYLQFCHNEELQIDFSGSQFSCDMSHFRWCFLQHKDNTALTPPTFSKYAQWLPKWISCSLKNQVNLRSSEVSWETWHGSTMLSPTVTSRWPAGLVITVASVNTDFEIFIFYTAVRCLNIEKYLQQHATLKNKSCPLSNPVLDVKINKIHYFWVHQWAYIASPFFEFNK